MNYVELAIPFFILAMGIEFLYGALVKKQTYRLSDTVNSLQLGVLSRLNDVLHLGFASIVFGALVSWLGVRQWSMNSVWQWIVAFIAYDFCYYWKHRYGHEWRILWASHVAHHQSEEFNLSTALRQTGTDYIGFVFYIPLFLVGIPAPVVVTVGSLNLIYQFWVHTEHVRRIGPFEWILVTPSNHRVHHARNPEYLDKNYGGVFILWDRLFGTFQDERAEIPCVYGITTGLHSWNPLWANFHFWIDTARISWRTKKFGDKIKVWFKAPAWVPNDIDAATSKPDWRAAKFNPPTSAFTRGYIFSQLWSVTFASLWLLKVEKQLPRSFVLAAFVWIVLSLYIQGVWLEGRSSSTRLEWVRLGSASLAALALSTIWPTLSITVATALGGYALVSAIALAIRHISTAAPAPKLS
jgi:alkylglycerol monooxygenase